MTLQEKFNSVIDFTLQWEGGYSDNPADSGGATNMGILQSEYTKWLVSQNKPSKNIQNITLEEAKTIYYNNYFLLLPEVNILCDSLLQVLLDTAVNFGLSGNIEFLQEAFNLPLTGKYDDTTKSNLLANNNVDLAIKICNNRLKYRSERVNEDPSQEVFLSGWKARDSNLLELITPVVVTTPSTPIPINPPIILNHDYVNTKQYIFELRNLLTGEITWLRGDNTKKSWVAINIDNLKIPEVVWLEGKPVVSETVTPTPIPTPIPIPITDIISKVLALAESERLVGGSDVKETNGNNSGPQVDKYLTYCGLQPGNPWCAALMAWLLGQFNISNPKNGDTWEWESWASENKILFKDKPQRGDMFLLLGSDGRPTHIGLIKDIDSTDTKYLLTIEGNESDSIKNCNDKLISNCEFIRWVNLVK